MNYPYQPTGLQPLNAIRPVTPPVNELDFIIAGIIRRENFGRINFEKELSGLVFDSIDVKAAMLRHKGIEPLLSRLSSVGYNLCQDKVIVHDIDYPFAGFQLKEGKTLIVRTDTRSSGTWAQGNVINYANTDNFFQRGKGIGLQYGSSKMTGEFLDGILIANENSYKICFVRSPRSYAFCFGDVEDQGSWDRIEIYSAKRLHKEFKAIKIENISPYVSNLDNLARRGKDDPGALNELIGLLDRKKIRQNAH